MAKIGRNSPCPCGSGKKYKRCCERKEAELSQTELPSGRFHYTSGSYGGPGRGYMPSILCYKEVSPESWSEHFCLVKPDAVFEDEDAAAAMADEHLAAAHVIRAEGGSNQDFAISLRREGYKNVTDFRVVQSEGSGEV